MFYYIYFWGNFRKTQKNNNVTKQPITVSSFFLKRKTKVKINTALQAPLNFSDKCELGWGKNAACVE